MSQDNDYSKLTREHRGGWPLMSDQQRAALLRQRAMRRRFHELVSRCTAVRPH